MENDVYRADCSTHGGDAIPNHDSTPKPTRHDEAAAPVGTLGSSVIGRGPRPLELPRVPLYEAIEVLVEELAADGHIHLVKGVLSTHVKISSMRRFHPPHHCSGNEHETLRQSILQHVEEYALF